MTELNNGIASEFIDLCIDNYNNGGHSSTKTQEHRYYELKHRIDNNHVIVEKIKEKIDELEPLFDFPSQVTRATLSEILSTILHSTCQTENKS